MPGQMQWRCPNLSDEGHRTSDQTKVLHFRYDESDRWKLYTEHPLRVSDHIMGPAGQGIGGNTIVGSRGYATMQKLLKCGYELLPTPGVVPKPMVPLSGISEEARQELLKNSLVRP